MTYAALLDGVSRPKLYKVERLNKLYEVEDLGLFAPDSDPTFAL